MSSKKDRDNHVSKRFLQVEPRFFCMALCAVNGTCLGLENYWFSREYGILSGLPLPLEGALHFMVPTSALLARKAPAIPC